MAMNEGCDDQKWKDMCDFGLIFFCKVSLVKKVCTTISCVIITFQTQDVVV